MGNILSCCISEKPERCWTCPRSLPSPDEDICPENCIDCANFSDYYDDHRLCIVCRHEVGPRMRPWAREEREPIIEDEPQMNNELPADEETGSTREDERMATDEISAIMGTENQGPSTVMEV